MQLTSSLRPSAVVSRCNLFEAAPLNSAPPARVISPSRFPLYVEPITDESLLSWLMRLALRLRISRYTLVSYGLGAEAHAPDSRWWCRPDPMFLELVSRKTGVGCEKLHSLTFQRWSPEVRDDEVPERFSAQRFIMPAPKRPLPCRVAVCPQCCKEDAQPYVRLTWTLGWVAICPRHTAILVRRCPACRAKLGFATFAAKVSSMPDRCTRCGLDLAAMSGQHADERALQLQEVLLSGKRSGVVQLPALGAMDWSSVVAAVDVLLGMIWIGTAPMARARLYARVVRDFGLGPQTGLGDWTDRYGALLLLAWLLDRWPRNLRAAYNFLATTHLPGLINRAFSADPDTRTVLKEIFRSATPHRPIQTRWKRWLDELPLNAQQLRERALWERYDYRRIRLCVLAQLREGHSVKTVAAAANLQPSTIYCWLRCATQHGLEAALERIRGRQQLTSAQAAELAHWIANSSQPRQPGFRVLGSRQVLEEARCRFGIEITVAMARRLLRMHCLHRRSRKRLRRLRGASTGISAPVRNLRT